MRFSTALTVLAAGAMASAGVIPKRSPTDIQNAFNDLGSKCDTIIPKFDDCKDDDCTNQVALQLADAINDTKNTIGPLTCGTGNSDVANYIAGVVTKVTNGLESHKNTCGSGCPNVLTDYAQVDSSLSGCLNSTFNLCSGLPALVTPLISSLEPALKDIGHTGVLGSLGVDSTQQSTDPTKQTTDPTKQTTDPTQQNSNPTQMNGGPTPKRSPTDIQNAFNNLGSKCDSIIPKFDDCKDDDCTNQVALQLVDAINDTKNTIGPLTCGTGNSDVANAIAGVVTKIADGLENHKNSCGNGCPNVVTDYAQVDSALSGCLSTSLNMCSGLPALVAPLLSGLEPTLKDIGHTGVIGALSLPQA